MENDDCVFCNIAQHKVPAQIFYEDQDVLVIQDILPKAPVHVLVIAQEHIPSVNDMTEAHQSLLGKMILAGKRIANEKGAGQTGYRLSFNVGKEGGQIVPHVHLHVMGGKQLPE